MRVVFALVALIVAGWLPAAGQQSASEVRHTGIGPTAPALLPFTLTVSTPKHCNELDGVIKFAALVDTAGTPQKLRVLEASDRRLIGFATEVVEAQRFKPATMDGSPTAAQIELTLGLHTCAQREKHPTGEDFYQFTLRAHPLIALAVVAPPAAQKIAPAARPEAVAPEPVGERISAPIPTVIADPAIPVSRKLLKRGLCLLGITIDANGLPQNIRLVRSLEPELDSNAMEAVKNWRFKPALRDGKVPVAVEGTVVANFEYVDREPVAFAFFISETPEKIEAAIAHHGGERIDVEAVNSDEVIARYMPQSRIGGRCLVSLLIDTNGVPQNVHIVKGLDSSLDLDTVAMVEHLRFKPVMQDGTTPAMVGLIIPVRYRMPVEKLTWGDLIRGGLALAIPHL
ncbi:MAG: energy transducer TonB [Terracidiphilus sp.]|jgi:TonB family protein